MNKNVFKREFFSLEANNYNEAATGCCHSWSQNTLFVETVTGTALATVLKYEQLKTYASVCVCVCMCSAVSLAVPLQVRVRGRPCVEKG